MPAISRKSIQRGSYVGITVSLLFGLVWVQPRLLGRVEASSFHGPAPQPAVEVHFRDHQLNSPTTLLDFAGPGRANTAREINNAAPPFYTPIQSTLQFKFPWPQGLWEYRDGWHTPGPPALDIGTRGAGADKRMLASADGVITSICKGNLSARVVINHNGTTLEYWHFDVNMLAPGIAVGQPVVQGQVLGVLRSGAWTSADDACGQAPGQQPDSAHLHWVIPTSGPFTVDGWTIQYPGDTWTSGSEMRNPDPCCPYNYLPSTNVPSAPVTVQKAGGGSGSVTSSPSGLDCGSDCLGGYAIGSSVTLTAVANSGSMFASWGGACSGITPSCVLSVDAAKSVTANFATQPTTTFTLTTARAGNGSGTITGPGINCGPDCSESYASGTTVTLQASPGSGSNFASWGGACSGNGACTITISAATSVTATFTQATSQGPGITVTRAGNGTGWVGSDVTGINCGQDCEQDYANGTQVTLRASADSGSIFAGWGGGSCLGKGDCVITVSKREAVTATFNLPSALDPPINLKAEIVNSNKVLVSWDYTYKEGLESVIVLIHRQDSSRPGEWKYIGWGKYTVFDETVRSAKTYTYRAHAFLQAISAKDNLDSDPVYSSSITMPACEYAVSNSGPPTFAAAGGNGQIGLQASVGCTWSLSTNAEWIKLSPVSGQGSQVIGYEIQANCTPSGRAGSIAISGSSEVSGQPLPITQAPNRTFSVSQFYPPDPRYNIYSGQWLTGDFDGDGKGDLIHLTDSDYVHPWISRGDGTFEVRQYRPWVGYNIRSGTWLTGDFNRDGRTDLLHVTDADYVHPWLSNGDGTFRVTQFKHQAGYNNRSGRWLAGDLNGDGYTDLIHLPNAVYMHPWLSRGDGTFDVKQFAPWGGYAVYLGSFVTGDFNGDRKTDLIHFVGGYIHVWLSGANGTFKVLSAFSPWAGYAFGMGKWLTGDFNGDGNADLVHITGSDYVHPWLSKGNGEFDVKFFRPMDGYATSMGRWAAADIDGDGKTDLVHIVGGDYVHPWLSKGDGTFTLSTFCPVRGYNGKSGWWVTTDLNGDRRTDLVHLVESNYVHPWTSGADQTAYSNALSVPGVPPCPGCPIRPNAVVWANVTSGRYHCRGTRLYGRTKLGSYMRQQQAEALGYRPAYKKICQ